MILLAVDALTIGAMLFVPCALIYSSRQPACAALSGYLSHGYWHCCQLVRSVDLVFMLLLNRQVPLWSLSLGIRFPHEDLLSHIYFTLLLILCGFAPRHAAASGQLFAERSA